MTAALKSQHLQAEAIAPSPTINHVDAAAPASLLSNLDFTTFAEADQADEAADTDWPIGPRKPLYVPPAAQPSLTELAGHLRTAIATDATYDLIWAVTLLDNAMGTYRKVPGAETHSAVAKLTGLWGGGLIHEVIHLLRSVSDDRWSVGQQALWLYQNVSWRTRLFGAEAKYRDALTKISAHATGGGSIAAATDLRFINLHNYLARVIPGANPIGDTRKYAARNTGDTGADAKHDKLFLRAAGDKQDIEMEDVQQLASEHCFGLSVVAAIAQKQPNYIRELILDQGDSYVVRHLATTAPGVQKPTSTKLSKELFADKHDQQFAHATSLDQDGLSFEVWPTVFSTFLAKLSGSFLAKGNAEELMHALFLKNVHGIRPEDDDFAPSQIETIKRILDSKNQVAVARVMINNGNDSHVVVLAGYEYVKDRQGQEVLRWKIYDQGDTYHFVDGILSRKDPAIKILKEREYGKIKTVFTGTIP